MATDEFAHLDQGDVVRHRGESGLFVVMTNYGGRVTAVCTVDMTAPEEWILVEKVVTKERRGERS